MNGFIIDCYTSEKAELISALRRLRSIDSVTDGGVYRYCRECSQVHIETTMTLEQVEDWLWQNSYGIGVVNKK